MKRLSTFLLAVCVRIWASPYSLLGILCGLIAIGRFRIHTGVIEIHGHRVAAILKRLPVAAAAITLGHVVLGQTQATLDRTRRHERVHVRQFERWGPLMGPAYLLASLIAHLRGRHYYRDNRFEVEAYRVSD